MADDPRGLDPSDPRERDEVGRALTRLTDPALTRRQRGTALTRFGAALGGRARPTVRGLTDAVVDLAPHVPVRDLLTLREQHGGLSGKELDAALITTATRVTAGIGAAGGALSAVQATAPPALLLRPAQAVVETLAVVLVEVRLVAELHVAHSRAVPGTPAEQGAAYLRAWVARRGLETGLPGALTVAATAARTQLRGRLVRRFGRSLSTLAPFLAGAVAGAELNRRETRALGEAVATSLREVGAPPR